MFLTYYDGHIDHNNSYNFASYITITVCLVRSQENLDTMPTSLLITYYDAHLNHNNHTVVPRITRTIYMFAPFLNNLNINMPSALYITIHNLDDNHKILAYITLCNISENCITLTHAQDSFLYLDIRTINYTHFVSSYHKKPSLGSFLDLPILTMT